MHHATRTPLTRGIRVVWVLGFLFGTLTHVVDLAQAGFHVYAGFPTPVRLFWVSLTVLDPAVIALVLLRRRTGVVLGVLIMLADVAVNATMQAVTGTLSAFGLIIQVSFLAVVLATAPQLWRDFDDPTPPPTASGQFGPEACGPGLPCRGPAPPPTDS